MSEAAASTLLRRYRRSVGEHAPEPGVDLTGCGEPANRVGERDLNRPPFDVKSGARRSVIVTHTTTSISGVPRSAGTALISAALRPGLLATTRALWP